MCFINGKKYFSRTHRLLSLRLAPALLISISGMTHVKTSPYYLQRRTLPGTADSLG